MTWVSWSEAVNVNFGTIRPIVLPPIDNKPSVFSSLRPLRPFLLLLFLCIPYQSWPHWDRLVPARTSSFECLLSEEQMQGRRLFCNEYVTRQRAQGFIELKELLAQKYVVISSRFPYSKNSARLNSKTLIRFG